MKIKSILSYLILSLIIIAALHLAIGQPAGGDITYNASETKPVTAADYLNTSGGSFTTLILNAETQNLKWKAYAGNVSGALVLDDAQDYSIYQWELTSLTGEVYASRNSSVEWGNIGCANEENITIEQNLLNHSQTAEDNINSTFSMRLHREFHVGTRKITESQCKSLLTWVNNTKQESPDINSPYQQLLLHDGSSMVYATFIDPNTQGFNFKSYDFQMILPDYGVGGYENVPYYFFVEIG